MEGDEYNLKTFCEIVKEPIEIFKKESEKGSLSSYSFEFKVLIKLLANLVFRMLSP